MEQQAFARSFRIGQKQETHLRTLYAKGTVEERMLKIKESKTEEIRGVINDEDIKKMFVPIGETL